MKRGDIVRHKLENEIYRILKVGDKVAICQCAPHHYKLIWGWKIWESYICHLENLEACPESRFIFDWLDTFDESYFPNRWKQLMKAIDPPKPEQPQLNLFA